MSNPIYICPDCCGDGLHHPDEDTFEVVLDDPCPTCAGSGAGPDAGNPIEYEKLGGRNCHELDVDFYVGEGIDDYQEFPTICWAVWHPGYRGYREPGGMQIEPDEPAGYEIGDCYFQLNDKWYSFVPTEDQEETIINYLEDDI